MKAKKGISLIVLVITIIVIIILAGAVILNLTKNNPMNSAKVASLTSTREALESATLLYTQQIIASTQGDYNSSDILTGVAKDAKGVTISGITTGSALADAVSVGVSTNLYKIDSTKTVATIDMQLPAAPTGANWYVEVTSGKCYLVFDNAQHYPTYMGTKPVVGGTTPAVAPFYPENATLAGFVYSLTNVAV